MFFNLPKVELEHTSALIFTVYLPSMKQHIKGLRESLSIEERIIGEKFKDFYLQERYIISHGLLRHLLAFFTNRDLHTIEYSINQFGKPFLKNNDLKVQFNMSHSGDWAAYIFTLDCQVGIEWKNNEINIVEISDLVFTEEEHIIFNKLKLDERFDTFYDIWTKKEAILKAMGKGLSYPMNLIKVLGFSIQAKIHCVSINNTIFYYSRLDSMHDYAGAVATADQAKKLIQIDILFKINYFYAFLLANF